jgi:hypothetical protein
MEPPPKQTTSNGAWQLLRQPGVVIPIFVVLWLGTALYVRANDSSIAARLMLAAPFIFLVAVVAGIPLVAWLRRRR